MKSDGNHEISLLAWYYCDALDGVKVADGRKLCVRLGAANIYAWAAYMIYDGFLDGEGHPEQLGTANQCARAMVRMYHAALPGAVEFHAFVEQVLLAADQANSLEVASHRMAVSPLSVTVGELPRFDDLDLLADRAMMHIIGPMAVLYASGNSKVGDDIWSHTLQAFRHYLIARQLNDDIHDWADDLQSGQATYVVVKLLRFLNITPGYYTFSQLMPVAKRHFWLDVLPLVCDTALGHAADARRLLRLGMPLAENNGIDGLLGRVEGSMRAALEQREQGRELLQSFASDASKPST
jgi:hypothetical protein